MPGSAPALKPEAFQDCVCSTRFDAKVTTAAPALSNSGVVKPPDTASLPDGHLAVTESSTSGPMTFAFEATFRPGWFVSQ